MRIALYGGSFNPPHVAHQLACAFVLATARPRVDELWMVPTFKHPYDKPLAPFGDRVEMCARAARLFDGRVKVSRIEEELGGESFTLTTVRALIEQNSAAKIAVVIGADLIEDRERWHGWPELRNLVDFIIVGRKGFGADPIALPPLSSTEVRAKIAHGESIDGLVDVEVADYIAARGLYR